MKTGYYTTDNSDLYLYFRPIEETETEVKAFVTLFYKKNYHQVKEPELLTLDKKRISIWKSYVFGQDL